MWPIVYQIKDLWVFFPAPPTVLQSEFGVKSYECLNGTLSRVHVGPTPQGNNQMPLDGLGFWCALPTLGLALASAAKPFSSVKKCSILSYFKGNKVFYHPITVRNHIWTKIGSLNTLFHLSNPQIIFPSTREEKPPSVWRFWSPRANFFTSSSIFLHQKVCGTILNLMG